MPQRSNISLYPWYRFFSSLFFWQAVWFLYFQKLLSPAEAILLYIILDLSSVAFEVPSGYLSDRIGRKKTLLLSLFAALLGAGILSFGSSFAAFACAQALLGAGYAFASGTDTSLLYESLAQEGREDEIEAHELRAWRFAFSASALSAVLGGVMSYFAPVLPFMSTMAASALAMLVCLKFREPKRPPAPAHLSGLSSLVSASKSGVLRWLFVLSALMYAFSHVPFVFGQPFMLDALSNMGWADQTPIISGSVAAGMMLISVMVSLVALPLRHKIGLASTLLLAFGIQVLLILALALSNSAVVILFLLLRMVPNALSQSFILARMHPLLASNNRATMLSLQSFVGRLLLATSLYVASDATHGGRQMAYGEIQTVLGGYVIVGLLCWCALFFALRFTRLEPPSP